MSNFIVNVLAFIPGAALSFWLGIRASAYRLRRQVGAPKGRRMIWTPATDTICTICGSGFLQADRRTGSMPWYVYETCSQRCDLIWCKSSPKKGNDNG